MLFLIKLNTYSLLSYYNQIMITYPYGNAMER